MSTITISESDGLKVLENLRKVINKAHQEHRPLEAYSVTKLHDKIAKKLRSLA
jgi:hypothetical protein